MDTEMATTNPLVSLPMEIFSNILEYLDWGDLGRLDTAFLNRDTRNSYLLALQLRKVKVERNGFWNNALDRGILSWLIGRNIRVISWDLGVNNAQLISISNDLAVTRYFSGILWNSTRNKICSTNGILKISGFYVPSSSRTGKIPL